MLESRFLLDTLHRSSFAKFYHELMQHLFVVITCGQLFFKQQIFLLLPLVKMNANYAEICWVGNLEADFQQVPFVRQKFQNFTLL